MDNGFNSQNIKDIIMEIRNSKRPDRDDYYRKKYYSFFEKFPKLFFAALNDSFDLRFFDMMLKQRDTIISSQSKEVMDQVSQGVYERLNERYLYPVFPKEELERMKAEMIADGRIKE